MSKIERFLDLVRVNDAQQIEFERDNVTPADLEALTEAYWTLDSWKQKAALIDLVQDHMGPRTRELMLDILQAPNSELEDYIVTKAIALSHLEEDFERFMVYYNDPQLLKETVQQFAPSAPAEPTKVQVELVSQIPEIIALVEKGSKRLNLFFYLGVMVGILLGPLLLLASVMPNVTGQMPSSDLVSMRILGCAITVLFGLVIWEQFGKLQKDRRLLQVLEQKPDELVWVYKEVSVGRAQKRAGGRGAAVARFVHIYFHLFDGSGSKVWLPEPEADRLLNLVCQEFSLLSCGYSSELEQTYKKSPLALRSNPQRVDGVKRVTSGVRYS